MSVPLWMTVCVVIPSGIGAVLYFLLRLPVLSLCPACNARIESDYHFCPQCAYQVRPAAATAIAPRALRIFTACTADITWQPTIRPRACTHFAE